MRLLQERIHLEPDGVLLLVPTGPIRIQSKAVRDMVEVLLEGVDPDSGKINDGWEPDSRLAAHYADLMDLFDIAGVTDAREAEGGAAFAKSKHVLIVGDAAWAPALTEELASAGIARVSFWRPNTADDNGTDTAVEFDLEALYRRIEVAAPGCNVSRNARPDGDWDLPEDIDLVIGALAPCQIGLQVVLERSCRKNGIAFLGAEIRGTTGSIGPVSIAATVGCWLCGRQRRLAHDPDPDAMARADRLPIAHYPPLQRDLARFFAQLVAYDVRCYLCATAPEAQHRHIRVVDLVRQSSARHGFVPMPFCEVCGLDGLLPNRPDAPIIPQSAHTEALRARFRDWTDPETGPIVGPILRELPQSIRRIFVAVAEVAPFCMFQTDPTPKEPACGKGLSADEAMLGAMGEAFERYAASRVDPDALVKARMADLAGPVIDPRLVGLYDTEQYAAEGFPFKPFDPAAQHIWGSATNLRNGKKTWVLASQLYYRLAPGFSDYVAQSTSNGLAAGTDLESASMRAVLELIERDAVMTAWLCCDPGWLMPIESCNAETRHMAAGLSSLGAAIALHVFDGAGGVPVVMCAAVGDGRVWPGLSATAAAHPDVRQAAQKAILEQAVSGVSLTSMLRSGTGPRPLRPQDVRCGHFLDHACYYLPRRQKELAFLQNARCYDPKVGQRTRPVANLAELVARLTDDGMEVVVADLTPPDVASASFYVVRAIAIGMQPLACGFAMECRGSEKLRRRSDQALNPAPHPFC